MLGGRRAAKLSCHSERSEESVATAYGFLFASLIGMTNWAGLGGAAAPRRFGEPFAQLGGRHRPGDVVALGLVAAECTKKLPGHLVLSALGHHGEAEIVSERDHGSHDRRVVLVLRSEERRVG